MEKEEKQQTLHWATNSNLGCKYTPPNIERVGADERCGGLLTSHPTSQNGSLGVASTWFVSGGLSTTFYLTILRSGRKPPCMIHLRSLTEEAV